MSEVVDAAASEAEEAYLDGLVLSKADQENVLLRPFALHLVTPVPDGVLENFLLWHLTVNVHCAYDWMMQAGGQEGLVRYIRDALFPVAPELVFAKWRRLLNTRIPVFSYWSFIACYVNDEGVQNMVRRSWRWEGPVGEQIYSCIFEYTSTMYASLLKSPFDRDESGFTILSMMYSVMRHNLGTFNLKQIILGGKLKPIAVPLSRNACRERDRDRRQAESLRREKEQAAARARPPGQQELHGEDEVMAETRVGEEEAEDEGEEDDLPSDEIDE